MADLIHFTTVATPDDVRQIFDLQARNLPGALSAETMASQGFVTVRHDAVVLQRMSDAAPAVIARIGDQVVGYALVMLREFAPDVPALAPMFALLEGLSWQGTPLRDNPRWIVMGQICVAEAHRGRGVPDGLYQHMREAYPSRYDFVITEVAERNTRSMRIHERVGFQTLHTHPDDTTGEIWRMIVMDVKA